MLKMFREDYDTFLSRLIAEKNVPSKRTLSSEERIECEERAKESICKIGASMYHFSKWMRRRYGKTIENDAIHDAIELGIKEKWLNWASPRSVNPETGVERRNIVVTEEGFEYIQEQAFRKQVSVIYSAYMLEPRRG